jgi:hypothetical protein
MVRSPAFRELTLNPEGFHAMKLIARTILSQALITGLVFIALGFWARTARADIMIGADFNSVLPIESRAEFGGGFAIRVGDQLHVPALALTPELVFDYASFSEAYGPVVYRGLVGARIGVGEIIRPGIFAHIGLGRFELQIPGADPSGSALTYDGGITLDFTLLPVVNFGVHGSYHILAADEVRERFRWLVLGAHLELVF